MKINEMEKRENDKARANFLLAFSCLAGKYGIDFYKDIDINFETMAINVKTDIEDRKLLAFIAELEELTGRLE